MNRNSLLFIKKQKNEQKCDKKNSVKFEKHTIQ